MFVTWIAWPGYFAWTLHCCHGSSHLFLYFTKFANQMHWNCNAKQIKSNQIRDWLRNSTVYWHRLTKMTITFMCYVHTDGITFGKLTWACENPSENRETEQINSRSGSTQATGRKWDCRNADKRQLPFCILGLSVMKRPKLLFKFNSVNPSCIKQWILY